MICFCPFIPDNNIAYTLGVFRENAVVYVLFAPSQLRAGVETQERTNKEENFICVEVMHRPIFDRSRVVEFYFDLQVFLPISYRH